MNKRLQIRLYDNGEPVWSHEFAGPAELGRQSEGEEEPYHVKMESGRQRIIIARRDEQNISRRYVLIEPVAGGKVRLTNLSNTLPLHAPNGGELGHLASREVPLPAGLVLGRITVRIQDVEPDEEASIQGLAEVTAPPRLGSLSRFVPLQTLGVPSLSQGKAFVTWLHAAMDVLQSAASSADFFDKAAHAAVELVNLDSARILLRNLDDWHTQAAQTSSHRRSEGDWQPSRAILRRLAQEKRTFWEVPDAADASGKSLVGITAVVAAPILNRHGEVIGALYGDRRSESQLALSGSITELEASLVELLARGVAAGLARIDQERVTLEARVRFEQFFTPQLAHQLELNPDLLQGRDTEVTLLFCDIRGFSRISEQLGPAGTVAWIGDIMATLSECVRANEGVLVDYIGDELFAMWGAPEGRPDHAPLACRAALDMLARLPELNERLRTKLKETMSLGIGVNTGVARVGNVGSPYKFKYGPLGHAVNLASRVQGATKYLKCPLLITGATRKQLDDTFQPRRLARARVINIAEPVELYELADPSRAGWAEARTEYEKALELFEKGALELASRILGELQVRHPEGPALALLYRAVKSLVEGPSASHPVWELPGK